MLVVEDDPAFRALAVQGFSEWGHEVVEAGSVAEALERAAARRPDTVVADIGLPDGNGFDLTAQLLALHCPLRVLIISSDHGAGNQREAQRVGAMGFVAKDQLFTAAVRRLIA